MKKLIALTAVTMLTITGCTWFAAEESEPTPALQEVETTQEKVVEEITSSPVEEGIYLGLGVDDYELINLATGESQEFLPEGYEILTRYARDYQYPEYLILEKEKEIYLYEIATEEITQIDITSAREDNKLKDSEELWVKPSITDKSKFFVTIADLKPVDGMFPYEILSSISGYYDASTNIIKYQGDMDVPGTPDTGGPFGGCWLYDSENELFYHWLCGEGLGSGTPLNTWDMNTGEEEFIIDYEHYLVHYNDGYLMYYRGTPEDPEGLVLMDLTDKNHTQVVYSMTDDQREKMKIAGGYGALYVEESNVVAFGGSDEIVLVYLNEEEKSVKNVVVLDDKAIYANYMFSDGKNLFYDNNKSGIQRINFDNPIIKKHAPTTKVTHELTLFKL